jgi:hypothetical protein
MEKVKFWEVESLGKRYIIEAKLKSFLEENGFFKITRNGDFYEVVRKQKETIEFIHLFEVKLFVIKYLIDNNIDKYIFSVIDKKKYFNINFLTEIKL